MRELTFKLSIKHRHHLVYLLFYFVCCTGCFSSLLFFNTENANIASSKHHLIHHRLYKGYTALKIIHHKANSISFNKN